MGYEDQILICTMIEVAEYEHIRTALAEYYSKYVETTALFMQIINSSTLVTVSNCCPDDVLFTF
jgi:hypothetical protein